MSDPIDPRLLSTESRLSRLEKQVERLRAHTSPDELMQEMRAVRRELEELHRTLLRERSGATHFSYSGHRAQMASDLSTLGVKPTDLQDEYKVIHAPGWRDPYYFDSVEEATRFHLEQGGELMHRLVTPWWTLKLDRDNPYGQT